jgi:hypothetical protein
VKEKKRNPSFYGFLENPEAYDAIDTYGTGYNTVKNKGSG